MIHEIDSGIRAGEAKRGTQRKLRKKDESVLNAVISDSGASFGEKLAALRKRAGLSQQEAAELISRECVSLGRDGVTNRAVSKWETGDTLPDAQQFICLCGLYGVSDVRLVFRGEPAADDPFRGLNRLGRERAGEYIGLLSESPRFSAQAKKHAVRRLKLFDLPASAGTGVFLDGESYTMIDVDETVPESAEFAVRISGDSMTPMFEHGSIVFVHPQQELASGDIGIFTINGEAYCKKFDAENGVRLISLNSAYKPIVPDEGCDFRIVGKVVK